MSFPILKEDIIIQATGEKKNRETSQSKLKYSFLRKDPIIVKLSCAAT